MNDTRQEFNNLKKSGYYNSLIKKCMKCGCIDDKRLILHHWKPLSFGGTNEINNVVYLCTKCHAEVHQSNLCVKKHSGGRPRCIKPDNADVILSEYYSNKINADELKQILGISKGTKISDLWYVKEFKKNNHIERYGGKPGNDHKQKRG